jgi:hypothetical protein
MTQVSTPNGIAATTESSPLDAVLAQTATVNTAVVQEPPEPEEQEQQEEKQDEKLFAISLKKAIKAYLKGNKGLLISRVEAGKHCHDCYVIRQENGHKDRKLTSQIIFTALAIEADSRGDCDPNLLAKLYQTVQILCGPEQWKALCKLDKMPLTVGRLEDFSMLIVRVEPTELYTIFDKDRLEDAKALFQWACGDGLHKVSRREITDKVQELKDPQKFAAKQVERAAQEEVKKAAEAQGDEVEDETEEDKPDPPQNLIPTQPDKKPNVPNYKDIPGYMGALIKEGNKQFPGHLADMLKGFAETLIWTAPMVKGLIAGIALGKDGKDAEGGTEALQLIVDVIGEEYSIYPSDEVEKEEAA